MQLHKRQLTKQSELHKRFVIIRPLIRLQQKQFFRQLKLQPQFLKLWRQFIGLQQKLVIRRWKLQQKQFRRTQKIRTHI